MRTGKVMISLAVFVTLAGAVTALSMWKMNSWAEQDAAAALMPEHSETVVTRAAWQTCWQPVTTAVGTVVAIRSVELANEITGTVSEVLFESGQIVEEGAMLLKLDTSVEEAELAAAQAMANLAKVHFERLQIAVEKQAVSAIEVDEARATFDQTKARVVQLETRMRKKMITAPFRARVGLRHVHPGQYLAEGTKITTLQGVDEQIHVDFTLPQSHSVFLGRGSAVRIQTATMPATEAVVVAMDSLVDRSTRNVMFRVKVPNGERLLRPGMYVDVKVPIRQTQQVVLVPATAVRRAAYGDHVYVVAADEAGRTRAVQRFVSLGAPVGANLIVTEGLQAGEMVATDGSFKLFHGVLVVAQPAEVD